MNSTQITLEKGVDAVPCVSGWCGKIIESQNLNNGELFCFHIYIRQHIQFILFYKKNIIHISPRFILILF